MTTRRKILTAALPAAILAGTFASGRATAAPDGAPLPTQTAPAQPAAPAAASAETPFVTTYEGHVTIEADRTGTDFFTKRFKILTPAAIGLVSQQPETYVEGMETLETVEAYTEKPNGTRVPVDPANIITRDAATGLQATFTRDLKQRTVIFQDVQVGDTLVLTQRKTTLHGLFPGQLFYADLYARTFPMDKAQVVVDAPAALDIQVKSVGAALSETIETVTGEKGEMRRHTFTLAKRPVTSLEPRSVGLVDLDPLLLISTFKSYAEMGQAYANEALPKAAVTAEIAALANEITNGIEARRDQAMAIDAWMKKNIRYVAVYLALGRVVPNDAASVLHNKFGDCKDKATLMSALLAAKGIASEQVLINLGNTYTLPEPPTMIALNHAILYLPEFDIYDDPTAQFAAFGVLAAETYDKPVVRVSAAGTVIARTPPMRPEDHVADVHTTLTVTADGTITGRTVQRNTGVLGLGLRAAATAVQIAGNENLAKRQLDSVNTAGTGHFDLGNATETAEPALIEADFTLSQKFRTPAQNARASIPVGLSLMVRPGNFLLGTVPNNRKTTFVCFAGRQIENIDATFDEALPMPVAPAPIKLDNAAFSYQASFAVEGRTFKVHREFTSHVEHQTCEPELEGKIVRDMNTVRGNLNANYVFRRPTPAPGPAVAGDTAAPAAQAAQATPPSQTAQANAASPAPANAAAAQAAPVAAAPTAHAAEAVPVAATAPTAPVPQTAAGPLEPPRPVEAARVAQAPAAAPAPGPQTLEFKRTVAADQKLRLDFLYSINPDCTSIGFATVRVVDQPAHGRITVERGTGFTNFPANNLRADCNKRRSDGTAVVYEPEPGYTGADEVNFEAIFATGTLTKRHYAIDIK